MSQDLLAEFGSFEKPQDQASPSNPSSGQPDNFQSLSFSNDWGSPTPVNFNPAGGITSPNVWGASPPFSPPQAQSGGQQLAQRELSVGPSQDDDWGDFEDAPSTNLPSFQQEDMNSNPWGDAPSFGTPAFEAPQISFQHAVQPQSATSDPWASPQKSSLPNTAPQSAVTTAPESSYSHSRGGSQTFSPQRITSPEAPMASLSAIAHSAADNKPPGDDPYGKLASFEGQTGAPTSTAYPKKSGLLGSLSNIKISKSGHKKAKPPTPQHGDVLFDFEAEEHVGSYRDAEDEDDFGEFEESELAVPPTTQPVTQTQTAEADLLGLGADFAQPAPMPPKPPPPPISQPPKPVDTKAQLEDLLLKSPQQTTPHSARSFGMTKKKPSPTKSKPAEEDPWDDFEPETKPVTTMKALSPQKLQPKSASKPTTPRPKSPPKAPEPDNHSDFDAWDDFTESSATPAPAETTQAPPSQPVQSVSTGSPNVDAIISKLTIIAPPPIPPPSSGAIPPTNVPPPAILLSLFPSLLSAANTNFLSPISSQPSETKTQILQHPLPRSFLPSYLGLLTVCARIIAGRKHRWKRDTRLSQSMRIGPAASRGTSGMKLAAVDRSESNKEDREVAEVLRAWRLQSGRVRGIISAAHSAGLELQPLPEMQETAPVRTAKENEGGVPAPSPCVVCGLKRNERVHKVDFEVWDGFGEWWVEATSSHVACRNFWEEHKEDLRSR